MNKTYDDCVLCSGRGDADYIPGGVEDGGEYYIDTIQCLPCPLCAMRAERDALAKRLATVTNQREANRRIIEIWKRNLQETVAERDSIAGKLAQGEELHSALHDYCAIIEEDRRALRAKYDTLYNEHVHELHGSMVFRRERDAATARAEAAERAAVILNNLITIRGLACDTARRSAAAWKRAAKMLWPYAGMKDLLMAWCLREESLDRRIGRQYQANNEDEK
jgi:hypothetical protein